MVRAPALTAQDTLAAGRETVLRVRTTDSLPRTIEGQFAGILGDSLRLLVRDPRAALVTIGRPRIATVMVRDAASTRGRHAFIGMLVGGGTGVLLGGILGSAPFTRAPDSPGCCATAGALAGLGVGLLLGSAIGAAVPPHWRPVDPDRLFTARQ